MKHRFYFDTSVFGRVFDTEFEKESIILFEKVNLGQIQCIYSDLTENEISKVPERIRAFFLDLEEDQKQLVKVTPEAFQLAQTYISKNVVGQTSLDDCIHIAVATLSKVDVLVSWNFKHIVNVHRIHGYNSVNLQLGHKILNICSPKEIIGDETYK
ncbi:PIN domain-containing protein [Dyadobacter frigoris]|uniref:Type II toxin-antitoxin system VapC family toxin n=1 Tax=Dyadobacter frigoris TaxID=2576211 RepID=A0A4U6D9K1_9BACT|nr:PIN domain-containing protein [Dyadobacter frigoris]TKT93061.1 type II toxin-antitoxin system VapC family toxin [Dyadobacter frigoris]GLU55934.1 hypothetical protein Dfri01_53950 [Dyadobacter frigoris]